MSMSSAFRSSAAVAITALMITGSVSASQITLGTSGWEAVIDVSLDPFVDINVVGETADAVIIQKSAEFTQPPVGGVFPSIPIVFRQTAWPAVSNIVIDDEIITNSTGVDWTDFHFDILDGMDAMFDPVATAASGGAPPIGFTIAPFTAAVFSPDNMRLDVSGGMVPDGGIWFPGDGASDGQLWIDVTPQPQEPFTVFTLKETPTPEPATVVLLGVCALCCPRRRLRG